MRDFEALSGLSFLPTLDHSLSLLDSRTLDTKLLVDMDKDMQV